MLSKMGLVHDDPASSMQERFAGHAIQDGARTHDLDELDAILFAGHAIQDGARTKRSCLPVAVAFAGHAIQDGARTKLDG